MSATGEHDTTLFDIGERAALVIEYDGASFNGWQYQVGENVVTVQGELERALSEIADTPVRVHCAGRTDAGVHASYQVVHFDCPVRRDRTAWLRGTNTLLPAGIAVRQVQPVANDFHARFSAQARRYRYIILNRPVRTALLATGLTWVRQKLDAPAMAEAAPYLVGEKDFSAFRAASCQSSTPMRRVDFARVHCRGDMVVLDIQANAFLHHMVRNIAGSLIAVGRGEQTPDWIASLLESRDRTLAAETAPPNGLYLVGVSYPTRYGLVDPSPGPAFLAMAD